MPMKPFRDFKLGAVQRTADGYCFNILSQHSAPLFSIEYATKEEADAARAIIVDALRGAVVHAEPPLTVP